MSNLLTGISNSWRHLLCCAIYLYVLFIYLFIYILFNFHISFLEVLLVVVLL